MINILNLNSRFVIILTALIVITFSSHPSLANSSKVKSAINKSDYISQGENTGPYWPTRGWKTCNPDAVGMDAQKLIKAIEYAATPKYKTEGILVIKNGYIVAESYFGDFKKDSQHHSFSVAKSFTSALIGIAIDKGLLSGVDERICQYYENWDCDNQSDRRKSMTLRHAMTLTSGLNWIENWSKLDNTTNDTLKMAFDGHFVRYVSKKRGLHEPGTYFTYSSGDPMLLSKVIQKATGKTAFEFAQQQVFEPLNIKNIRWDKDMEGYTNTSWGIHTTIRDYAKFGFLYLNNGQWDKQRIVSKKWVEQSTKTDTKVNMWPALGYLWHVNLPLRFKARSSYVKKDMALTKGYMAEGFKGQSIVILPTENLLIVKVANQNNFNERIDLLKLIAMILHAEKKN